MRKVTFSELVPHLMIGATIVTLLVVFLINRFPPLKEPEFIDESSYSESSSLSIKENNIGSSIGSSGGISTPASGNSLPSSAAEPQSQKININTATVTELMTLDGIGEVKAKAIVEYREANGYFKSIDDLTLVSGIGVKTLEKNRDKITV